MKSETKKILQLYDEDQAWEFPSNFNAQDIEKRARQVHNELCEKFGILKSGSLKFKNWIHHQDASFGLAIVFEPHQPQKPTDISQLAIRFSNFGNLASFNYQGRATTSAHQTIIASLSRNGFTYIDPNELNTPYDGIMSPNKAITTWWIRYFDWL